MHQLPGFVYFDHSAHVTHGVGCVECHGRVDTMGAVYPVAPLTMQWCLDCHRDPDEHLRPESEITNMEWLPSEPRRAIGARAFTPTSTSRLRSNRAPAATADEA